MPPKLRQKGALPSPRAASVPPGVPQHVPMPVRFDAAGGGYSAAADRAAAAARSHSTAAHHGALESEIAARTKRQEEAAAAAAAESEAAAATSLLDMFPPWRLPGQPTRPRAVHIGPTTIELEWELLDGGGAVSGHQVRIR